VVGYQGEDVIGTLGDEHRETPISYVEQADPEGTAHAIGQAREVVNDRFIALNGNVLIDASLPRALADTDGHAIATTTVEDPSSYGIVSVHDDGDLDATVERPSDPPTNLANVGCYAFESEVFDHIDRTAESERGEFEITETLADLLADDRAISAVEYDGRWLDVGRPWELLRANELLVAEVKHTVEGLVAAGTTVDGDVVVEAGATVRDGVTIKGPAVVQSGAGVGPNAYIRGATVVGRDARVGHSIGMKNSVLLADAVVPHLSYVGDSIRGWEVKLRGRGERGEPAARRCVGPDNGQRRVGRHGLAETGCGAWRRGEEMDQRQSECGGEGRERCGHQAGRGRPARRQHGVTERRRRVRKR
jgi:bifunctional UDP-N-acetylglucosamine pyrophosphorylase/glucosamine-1-phosphate N-acetyltransferase